MIIKRFFKTKNDYEITLTLRPQVGQEAVLSVLPTAGG